MNITDEKNRTELAGMWAAVVTLRQLNGNRGRGEFLVDKFTRDPVLAKYFRCVYDPRRHWAFRSYDMKQHASRGPITVKEEPTYFLKLLYKITKELGSPQAERAWWATLAGHGPETQDTAHLILDRDLRCSLTHHTLNRALEKAGLETIDFQSMKLEMSYLCPEQRFCMGVLSEGNTQLGQLAFQVRCVVDDLARLAEYGVAVVVPKHLKEQMPRR